MSKKHHGGPAPIPAGNRSADFPTGDRKGKPVDEEMTPQTDPGAGFQEQDPKRRLGDYTTEGEHARQQPGPLNDGNTHSK